MPTSLGALAASVSGTFDGTGTARASIGPTVYGVSWTVERMATNTTSVLDTTLRVYRNVESTTTYVDGSSQGNNDVSDGSTITLRSLDKLVFVWTGGTPGAIATVTLDGEQTRI